MNMKWRWFVIGLASAFVTAWFITISVKSTHAEEKDVFPMKQLPWTDIAPGRSVAFYGEDEEVGTIKWDDIDGDGKPNFRWEGTDIEETARLFIKHLTQITSECSCPKEKL